MGHFLIVGGSTGVGKELVNLLEQSGNTIDATYHKNKVESRPKVTYTQLDVLNNEPNADFLPDCIDGMAYCPGSINLKPFHRFSEDDFLNDFKLQVLGATNLLKQILPRLKKSEQASIVLFSTVAVQQGYNFHSQVATSKGQ